ncbi:MAG: glycosyltransferase family 39 protein [Deltaproteobacteria bacterium]|nr:glycosyltransferase family 39 protein [Deltaproteobacteria bacterium]MBI3391431.1 glycosyltransferase family 39 protein [Deltaproteobacteria bacterium]
MDPVSATTPSDDTQSLLGVRLILSGIGVSLWWWGVANWPRLPTPYGIGFWAWAVSFIVLLAAWAPPPQWRRLHMTATGWIALAILIVAAIPRFYRVTDIPYAIHFDENNAFPALEAMRTGTAENIFSRIDRYSTGNPGLAVALQWLLGFVSPNWFSATRYSCAAWGVLSIATTYALGRRLSGPAIAIATSLALTVSHWHLVASRFSQSLSAAFGASLIWWLLVRACDSGRISDAIIAGIAAGLALQLYDPIKVVLVTVLVWWLWHATVTRGFARRTTLMIVVSGAVASMVLIPMLRTDSGLGYLDRAQEITALGPAFRAALVARYGSLQQALLHQLEQLARIVIGGAEMAANHNDTEPLVDTCELIAAALGVLVCAAHARDWRFTIAPLWLVLTLVAVALSSVPEASYRLAVALPALAILIGLGVGTPLNWLRRRLPRAVGFALTAVCTLGFFGYDAWIGGARTLHYLTDMNHAHEVDTIARTIAAGPTTPVYYVESGPAIVGNHTFQALTHTHSVVNIPNLVDQVPRVVDVNRPAVFVIPYWSQEYSVAHVQRVYPAGVPHPLTEPSGSVKGWSLAVDAPTSSQHADRTSAACGLRRTGCAGAEAVIDAYLAFFDLNSLCDPHPPQRIEWHGTLIVPDGVPTEVQLAQAFTTASLTIDGAAVGSPLRVVPGPHAIGISAEIRKGPPATLVLSWRGADQTERPIPCEALRPTPQG